jgi:hypothetical protein
VTTLNTAAAALAAATGAALPYIDMRVIFVDDDGNKTEYFSHADQRDVRRANVVVSNPELDPIGFNRAVAWAYLTRTAVIDMGWADFDRDAAFVVPPPDEQTTADPTTPATAG